MDPHYDSKKGKLLYISFSKLTKAQGAIEDQGVYGLNMGSFNRKENGGVIGEAIKKAVK